VEGRIAMFAKAREFLAEKSFARNVRIADVVSVMSAAFTGGINAGQQLESTYTGGGSYAGPLDDNGNMPSSSMGIIIASAVIMPRRWVAAEEDDIEGAFQQLVQDTSHVVRVAGTDVLAKHASFSGVYAGLETGVAVGPIYGPAGSSRHLAREDEPMLVVAPSDRVQQYLFVRRTVALGAVTVTPELLLQMVVADTGFDQ